MAEDCLIGFKFNDREDNMDIDKAVLKASDAFFVEATFDSSFDHFGAKGGVAESLADGGDFGGADAFESFDFNDVFDFGM